MFMKSQNNECCALYCRYGLDDGVLLKVNKDDYDCEIALVSDNFNIISQTGWKRFKEKCKRIWCIIRNEECNYFDIFISDDDLDKFKEFVANI